MAEKISHRMPETIRRVAKGSYEVRGTQLHIVQGDDGKWAVQGHSDDLGAFGSRGAALGKLQELGLVPAPSSQRPRSSRSSRRAMSRRSRRSSRSSALGAGRPRRRPLRSDRPPADVELPGLAPGAWRPGADLHRGAQVDDGAPSGVADGVPVGDVQCQP